MGDTGSNEKDASHAGPAAWPDSAAVAGHPVSSRHQQMVRLVVGALDQEPDVAQAADARNGSGVIPVLRHNRQAKAAGSQHFP